MSVTESVIITEQPCLALHGIGKRFFGVPALAGVDLEVRPGEIHALIGENGAGKSTLINISTGVLQPDEGQIRIGGAPATLHNPLDAAARGVIVVHQEADLFAELSLAENMLLGRGLVRGAGGLVNWRATHAEARRELAAMGETGDVRAPARTLSIGRRVIAEIAAAVAHQPRVLFLDEPTASLTHSETRRLIEQLLRLKAAGVGIVYVSHRLEEVLEISDRVTVLRDGRHVTTRPIEGLDMDQLVALMVGREITNIYYRQYNTPGEVALNVEGLTSPDSQFRDVSFNVRRGEIVGLYGLVGAGRTEMAQAIFGLARAQGTVRVGGRAHRLSNPRKALAAGLAYLPEDRLTQSIFATHSCKTNVTAAISTRLGPFGFISSKRETSIMERVHERFRVKLDSPEQAINTLSGGNQQKIVLGRWLESGPEVLLLDEPTRGVDVGAKAEIHKLIDELAARGKAILMISSELPEVLGMSDRVLVMAEGRITGEFDPRRASQDDLATAAIPRARSHNNIDYDSDYDSNRDRDSERKKKSAGLSEVLGRFRELGICLALAVIVLAMTLGKPAEFATARNLVDVLTSASIAAVAAAGMTFVIITGSIDIAVGSVLGLVGAAAGLAALHGLPAPLCLALAIGLGAMLGGVNSLLSTLGRIHPIIVTLAGISIYRGIMLKLTGGYEVSSLPEGFRALAEGRLLGLPKVLWYAVAVSAVMSVILSRTIFGRRLLAVGNSEKAATLIGLSPWRLRLMAFAILGGLVGLASVLWAGYYGKVQNNTGTGFEMRVIAATVIGGCSILGGRGTILGTFLGAVLMALIYNALVILKISAFWQDAFVGALILGAVALDIWLPALTAALRRGRAARQRRAAQ